jgi:hypothetical protein
VFLGGWILAGALDPTTRRFASESEMLRVLASDARNRPQLLTTAVEQLGTPRSRALPRGSAKAPSAISADEATTIAVFGLGSLLSPASYAPSSGIPAQVDDETLVDTWVQMMATALAKPATK